MMLRVSYGTTSGKLWLEAKRYVKVDSGDVRAIVDGGLGTICEFVNLKCIPK